MAIHDGFFDAEFNEVTGKYDREYNAEAFIGYFGSFIGDGVCVYRDPESLRVSRAEGGAVVAPGYLFIQGYWLKNDAPYEVPVPGGGDYAIAAHLNTSLRFIEITAVPKASPEVYPDSLVLGYIDAAGAVTDTRGTALCGMIDAVGGLSQKVAWAVEYIDTQAEQRLKEAENRLSAQSQQLDAGINRVLEELSKVAPPPVGSIRFTAGGGEEGWLRCDGSFVSAEDYPELVEALGRLDPGIGDYDERLNAYEAEPVSNIAMYGGMAWVYLVRSRQLVGAGQYANSRIQVSGAEDLDGDVVLSISGGSLWLIQDMDRAYEAAEFTGDESYLELSRLDVRSKSGAAAFSQYVWPQVVKAEGTCYMAYDVAQSLIYDNPNYKQAFTTVKYLTWRPGQFGSAAKAEYSADYQVSNQLSGAGSLYKLLSVLSFSPKNSGELLMPAAALASYNSSFTAFVFGFGCGSILKNTFGDPKADLPAVLEINGSSSPTNKYYVRYVKEQYAPQLNIVPIAGNGEILYTADLTGRRVTVTWCTYSPKSLPDWYEIPIDLPDRARLFKGSVCYAQGMWFVFVGTGLLFSPKLRDGKWGYLDTAGALSAITAGGSLDYDQEGNALWLCGTTAAGTPKLCRLQLPESFNYADTGAWLPSLSMDGIPGYIKALDVSARIEVAAEPSNAGIVTGGGSYSKGSTVTVTAAAKSPGAGKLSEFAGWYEGGTLISAEPGYTFTAEASRSLTARFTVTRDPALALPSPYRKVEYIIFDTNPGIDTGIKPSSATLRVQMELEMPAAFTVDGDILVSKDKLMRQNEAGQTWSYMCEVYRSGPERIRARSGYNGIFIMDTTFGGRQLLDYNGPGKSFSLGGTSMSIENGTELQDSNLFIGRLSSDSTRKSASFNLYSCKMYVNGILMRDFVPCLDGSANAGLYDRVTKSFYGNSLSGSLGAGPLVE